jgi:hypothetical protein
MLQKQILQIANLRFRMYELTGAGTGTGRLRCDVRDRTTKLMFSKFAILPYAYCYSFTKESLPYLLKLMLVIYFVLALRLGDWSRASILLSEN